MITIFEGVVRISLMFIAVFCGLSGFICASNYAQKLVPCYGGYHAGGKAPCGVAKERLVPGTLEIHMCLEVPSSYPESFKFGS